MPRGISVETLRGYDDRAGVMWFSDSMYGAASYLSYADFDRLWNVYNRSFFPVFPRGWEASAALVVSGRAVVAQRSGTAQGGAGAKR